FMMRNVYDDFFDAACDELVERVLDHRFAGNRDQRFGHRVGQRLESRAVTGGEHHGFFDLTAHRSRTIVSRRPVSDVATLPAASAPRVVNGIFYNPIFLPGSIFQKLPGRGYAVARPGSPSKRRTLPGRGPGIEQDNGQSSFLLDPAAGRAAHLPKVRRGRK